MLGFELYLHGTTGCETGWMSPIPFHSIPSPLPSPARPGPAWGSWPFSLLRSFGFVVPLYSPGPSPPPPFSPARGVIGSRIARGWERPMGTRRRKKVSRNGLRASTWQEEGSERTAIRPLRPSDLDVRPFSWPDPGCRHFSFISVPTSFPSPFPFLPSLLGAVASYGSD